MTQAYTLSAEPNRLAFPNQAVLWFAFWAHVLLLALAATNFSIVAWLWKAWSFQFNAYTYYYENGWGYVYNSGYTFPQTICYVAAYMFGLIYFGRNWKLSANVLNALAVLLCGVGTVCYAIELSHWFTNHHLSFVVSAPGLVLVLAIITALMLKKQTYRKWVRGALS